MQLIIFIGLPATGKSSFYHHQFFRSHVRVNRDMLRTKHRETLLVDACLAGKTPLVVDNTNLTKVERSEYISKATASRFEVHGYFFESRVVDALSRNSMRSHEDQVPEVAIRDGCKRLQLPDREEGFDQLFFVRFDPIQGFVVDEWHHEV